MAPRPGRCCKVTGRRRSRPAASGGGAGLGVTTTALAGGLTEITVTRAGAAKAALLAQARAALGDGAPMAGSATVHGGGTTSAVAEMLKPR
jgi:hypothetical protein